MQGSWVLIIILLLPFLVIPIIAYIFFKHSGDIEQEEIEVSPMPITSDEKHSNGEVKNALETVSPSPRQSPFSIVFFVLAGGFIAGGVGFILGHSYGAWDASEIFFGILRASLFMALGMLAGAVIWSQTRR